MEREKENVNFWSQEERWVKTTSLGLSPASALLTEASCRRHVVINLLQFDSDLLHKPMFPLHSVSSGPQFQRESSLHREKNHFPQKSKHVLVWILQYDLNKTMFSATANEQSEWAQIRYTSHRLIWSYHTDTVILFSFTPWVSITKLCFITTST